MKDTKSRFTLTIDSGALDEARRLTGARSKRETIARALEEMLKSGKRKQLADLVGTGVFAMTEAQLRKRRRQKHGRSA
jgi:hypothetical protein